MMKPEKALFGSILILIGIVLLLANLNLIPTDVWKYWPLILVFLGIAVIFSQQLHIDVNDHGLKPVASAKTAMRLQADATALPVRVRSSAASRQRLPRTRGRSVKGKKK